MEEQKIHTLNLVEKPSTYKLIIPELVQRKIREWCLQFPDNEWSGTLFYTVKGSFADGSFTAICKDFYVSDIGTEGYTEFDHEVDIVTYADEHDLLDCYQALLHSHNKMAAWFSGTDRSTLIEQGMTMPHFLSLIVNNSGDYVAKITRRVTLKASSVTYPTYGQKEAEEESQAVINEYLEAFSLNIEIEGDNVRTEVLQRIKEIKEEKEKKKTQPIYKPYYSPTLFPVQDDKLDSIPSWEKNWKKNLTTLKPEVDSQKCLEEGKEYKVKIPDEIVQRTLIQLLTGSVTSGMSSSFDLSKWLTVMDKVYKRRFSTKKALEDWLYTYIEYLSWSVEWKGSDLEDPDEIMEALLESLYNRIDELSVQYKSTAILVTIKNLLKEFISKEL